MPPRILAIGDVHGCDAALEALLAVVRVQPEDTVVFLGDLMDHGPGSKEVMAKLIELKRLCKVVYIMGNHEELMRDAISGRGSFEMWERVGGKATMESYGGDIEAIPPDHIRALLSAQPFWETDTEIFVHACLEPEVALSNQTRDWLRWKHLGGSERPHRSGKRVICGHTAQTDGYPLVFTGWVCLDTFCLGGKYLSCLDVGQNEVYQASQSGDLRQFPLSKFS